MALSIGINITFLFVQVLVSLTHVPTVQSISVQQYKIRQNCKIKEESSMQEYHLTAPSLTSCATQCTDSAECISISWNLNTSECMLSVVDTIFEMQLAHREYEEAEGWTCATLVRFPVFRALASTYAIDRYEMSFQQASARCTELGTSLADPSSLTTAQNLGLQYCNCAWMSNEKNALLLDNPSACWYAYNTGPVICGMTTADAWCLMV